MPRATLPPTPGSSTDIRGRDGTKQLATLQMALELPEPAMINSTTTSAAAAVISPPRTTTKATPYPMQASEAVKSRRRSSTAQNQVATKDQFALPPPPTRCRKIIQVKPREERVAEEKQDVQDVQDEVKEGDKPPQPPATTTGSKRKQPSATSAAGRKIARKTAHSLIERRRRSKMNEEFGVLKDMIPACHGEMHKLAILQASIEYIRYLQDCVTKLKEQHGPDAESVSGTTTPPTREPHEETRNHNHSHSSTDVEMTGSEVPSPSFSPQHQPHHHHHHHHQSPSHHHHQSPPHHHNHHHDHNHNHNHTQHPHPHHSRSHQPSISPAILPQDAHTYDRCRHNSYSSISTDHHQHRHYSYTTSAATSPAFGPQQQVGPLPPLYATTPTISGGGKYVHPQQQHQHQQRGSISAAASTLTRPALEPQRERNFDQEATAALLMLNRTDRRAPPASGRGMSVRDLLAS